ncbi:hypothetical protein CONPUDRAFT_167664 [Coniophora puteana RWD-64-598 SS2]|uniref:BTB domain-containing protein n=1 Tax=Coniophora puteana (strain RWD-64-598) TaxID=741705 RepID=A0A5M3MIK0_CONPW|nr:uncharacterized protein CONPUDRAFT_167664 [Coniophora puteana RWD-64-598 SS2]EIW78740.1 hypothetical protein CONPUDRAFT_167664 [Coniophora puteana RWD-64-598 SS2]
MASPPPPVGVQEAARCSTQAWQDALTSLFAHSKDRFPDVVWELQSDGDHQSDEPELVWGHKAIVYARAPPSFQARYFQFRPAPAASPSPYSPSATPAPAQSSLSLSLTLDLPRNSRSPSPFGLAPSPAPSTLNGGNLRIPLAVNSVLFSNELEYLYTGKGLGEAFEFLFDTSDSRELVDAEDAEENRLDKLRKDLVFMWRSRLYSDVRIQLSGTFSSSNHEPATAIFSSHKFILMSRSPYFYTQFISWGTPTNLGELATVTLPSPPFTPASLHFTLGYIYTGTLVFSHRTYDLDTAFAIMKSATYLQLDCLYDEVQSRIVQEMLHGLFHAFLEFTEYERITGGKWGTGGCRCRQCARRIPRVLEFAIAEDVKNSHLERGARRALVGIFGEGWCTSEFATLPQKTRDNVLKGLAKRTTPLNVFPLLFSANHALRKLDAVIDAWADISRDMVNSARKAIDDCLVSHVEECFEQPDWLEIMDADGVHFEDGERVGWVMDALKRGLNEKYAGMVYQTLISSILLRTQEGDVDSPMLSKTSQVRVQVDETRADVLRWMRKRWMGIRQEGGFDGLETWTLSEISHDIDIPVEDMQNPNATGRPVKNGRPSLVKTDDQSDTVSMHSLRASVLNRSTGPKRDVASSSASVRSARSAVSRRPHAPATPRAHGNDGRPDSKLTPDRVSLVSVGSTASTLTEKRVSKKTPSSRATDTNGTTPRTTPSRMSTASTSTRTKSLTPSLHSRPSNVSTRSGAASDANGSALPSLRIPSNPRPASALSSATSESSTFRTAPSPSSNLQTPTTSAARARRQSTASSVSTASARTVGTAGKSPMRTRISSTYSTASTATTSSAVTSKSSVSRLSTKEPIKPNPNATIKASPNRASTAARTPASKVVIKKQRSPPVPTTDSIFGEKGKAKETARDDGPAADTETPDQIAAHSRTSTETITASTPRTPMDQTASLSEEAVSNLPRGACLDIGIPCIISSKRKRFRAFARYIGEVEGEVGPWVGVEVPIGDGWAGDPTDGRQWNDGTWGGVRYFDIGNAGSEWEFGDDHRAPRRRRVDWINGSSAVDLKGSINLKRDANHLTVGTMRSKRLRSASPAPSDLSNQESRGLFVRPQQVLYVVDAVGEDL